MCPVDQRQPLLALELERVEPERGQRLGAGDQLAVRRSEVSFAEQGQKGMGGGRQVAAGSKRSRARYAGHEAAVDQSLDPLDDHGADPRVPEQKPVGPDRHRPQDDPGGEVCSGAGGMAAEQVDLEVALELRRDCVGDQRTEPGADPVHGRARAENLLEHRAVSGHPRQRLGVDLDARPGRDRRHLCAGQLPPERHGGERMRGLSFGHDENGGRR